MGLPLLASRACTSSATETGPGPDRQLSSASGQQRKLPSRTSSTASPGEPASARYIANLQFSETVQRRSHSVASALQSHGRWCLVNSSRREVPHDTDLQGRVRQTGEQRYLASVPHKQLGRAHV